LIEVTFKLPFTIKIDDNEFVLKQITSLFLKDGNPIIDLMDIPLNHLYIFAGNSNIFKGQQIS